MGGPYQGFFVSAYVDPGLGFKRIDEILFMEFYADLFYGCTVVSGGSLSFRFHVPASRQPSSPGPNEKFDDPYPTPHMHFLHAPHNQNIGQPLRIYLTSAYWFLVGNKEDIIPM